MISLRVRVEHTRKLGSRRCPVSIPVNLVRSSTPTYPASQTDVSVRLKPMTTTTDGNGQSADGGSDSSGDDDGDEEGEPPRALNVVKVNIHLVAPEESNHTLDFYSLLKETAVKELARLPFLLITGITVGITISVILKVFGITK